MREASKYLIDVAALRQKYKGIDKGQVESTVRISGSTEMSVRPDGIIAFEGLTTDVVPWTEFYDDILKLEFANAHASSNATCRARLQVLEESYKLHTLLNADVEERTDRHRAPGGLFSQCMRVDNYVRLQAGMNAQQLVHFIRNTCEARGNDTVHLPKQTEQTLQSLLDSLDISSTDTSMLTVEGLGLHPTGEKRFIRFDVFDPDVNKGGKAAATLLNVFLSRTSSPHGRYFAELVRPLLHPASRVDPAAATPGSAHGSMGGNHSYLPQSPTFSGPGNNQSSQQNRGDSSAFPSGSVHSGGSGNSGNALFDSPQSHLIGDATRRSVPSVQLRNNEATEFTLQVFGNAEDEWLHLARWVQQHKLANPRRNVWIVEIPRIASIRKSYGFDVHQGHMEKIFLPLFLATQHPEDPQYQDLAALLANVGGFTIRSDEEARAGEFSRTCKPPMELPWNTPMCDLHFAYYFWANLTSLNALRCRRGMNTFELRANAGERPTQLDSVMYSYLLCDSISHGVVLDDHPVLQYLYGMNQIGIAMSPLTNNATDIEYPKNPFHRFFIRSLRVALCTDSPLHYHDYDDPLLEEYSTATKIFRLSPVDVSELARNSVLISAFPDSSKKAWLGTADYMVQNVQAKSGVPDSRVDCRRQLWDTERILIARRMVREERRRASIGGDALSDALGGSTQLESLNLPAHARALITGKGEALDDPLEQALRMTAKEAEKLAAVHGFARGGNFRLLPGGSATEKLAVYVTVDKGEGDELDYPRIKFVGPTEREGPRMTAAKLLKRALDIRHSIVHHVPSWKQEYRSIETAFEQNDFDVNQFESGQVEGVFVVRGKQKVPRLPSYIPPYSGFVQHLADLREIVDNVHVKTLCYRRLKLLEDKFRLHHAVSHSVEASTSEDKASSNRDFYQTCKVDTNVRMETGMTARQLLRFILSKARQNADDIVCHREGQEPQTLRQLLTDMHIDPDHLTVDDLNVQVDTAAGINSAAFTPEGRDPLLTLLLKTDNEMKGRYFAELTKMTFEQFKRDSFTFAENRLPIYGATVDEWENLSHWFDTHGMACYNNQWMVQFPRIYSYLHRHKKVKNFGDYLEHIFKPLWEVSLHPSKYPRLCHFLNHVSGFDCVEDERAPEKTALAGLLPPQDWISADEPPYNYYMYFLWANVRSLNEFRMQRKFSTFSFRPSCGEAGSVDHLLGAFLVANNINYGLGLRHDPVVQYLYYLAQIGIAVSPLSNNTKLLEYLDNPFPEFFRRGLDVSLSTDSPLQYHHTQEPLIEEYSIASKVWKLSPTDMCEIARNSVRQSGFGHEFKQTVLGDRYFLSSSLGNDESRTHLSSIRVAYRWETYHTEVSILEHMSGEPFRRAMMTAAEEADTIAMLNARIGPTAQKGIIAASTDEAAMTRLRTQRDDLVRKLAEHQAKLDELRENTRVLSDRYHEFTAREAQLAELRKNRRAELEQQIATAQAAANVAAAAQGLGHGGSGPGSNADRMTRSASFATSLSRRMSLQSQQDLARAQSNVTTHFEMSHEQDTNNDDVETESATGGGTSPARAGSRASTRATGGGVQLDFRTASETPWLAAPMFAPPHGSSGSPAGGDGAPPTGGAGRPPVPVRPRGANATASGSLSHALDDEILRETQRLVAKHTMPASGVTSAPRGVGYSSAGAHFAPNVARSSRQGPNNQAPNHSPSTVGFTPAPPNR